MHQSNAGLRWPHPFRNIAPMLARVFSATVQGIEAFPVEVEVNDGWGGTMTVIVGLPASNSPPINWIISPWSVN